MVETSCHLLSSLRIKHEDEMKRKIIIIDRDTQATLFCSALGIDNGSSVDGKIETDEYIITWKNARYTRLHTLEEHSNGVKLKSEKAFPCIPDAMDPVPNKENPQTEILRKILERPDEIEEIIIATEPNSSSDEDLLMIKDFAVLNKIILKRAILKSLQKEEIIRELKNATEINTRFGISGRCEYAETVLYKNFSYLLGITYSDIMKKHGDYNEDATVRFPVSRREYKILTMLNNKEKEKRTRRDKIYNIALKMQDDKGNEFIGILTKEEVEQGYKKKDAEELCTELSKKHENATIVEVKRSKGFKKAPQLFNLEEIINFCEVEYNYSIRKTITILRRLYDFGYITSPFTNSKKIAYTNKADAVRILYELKAISDFDSEVEQILKKDEHISVKDHYIERENSFCEGIRPLKVEKLNLLSEEERSLWKQITLRFISIFASPIKETTVTLQVAYADHTFTSSYTYRNTNEFCYADITGIGLDKNIQKMGLLANGLAEGTVFKAQTTPIENTSDAELRARYKKAALVKKINQQTDLSTWVAEVITLHLDLEKLEQSNFIALDNNKEIKLTKNGMVLCTTIGYALPTNLSEEMHNAWDRGILKVIIGEANEKEYISKVKIYVCNQANQIRDKGFVAKREIIKHFTEAEIERKKRAQKRNTK